ILVRALRHTNWLTHLLNRLPISTCKAVSPFGGIPVILSFFTILWSFYFAGWVHPENLRLFQVITLGVGLMTLLGVYDDIYHCSARTKLFFQVAIATVLYFAGFQIERIGDMVELGPFSILLTILWIVGITNSVNLIDGMDGLASGVIFLSCMTLVFVYMERDILEASFLAVILAGSVLGFFLFNFPPAKIILGDTGSLPLGLMVALITLLPLNQQHTDEIYYLIPVITLLLPILDTSFAFCRRFFKGVSPFSKDIEHFHHRLARLGYSPLKSISILFALCLYFDLTALVPAYNINLIPKFIPIYLVFLIGNIAILVYVLKRLENKKRQS
ncbi:MAG: undecaprenyl/decaprenyl-phosphate alpha-N-acetylglucosaminyl 1-phosphate transferase, partial [Nitrospinae bacterium]|nr:undecaprenyl/decaprenyl-phosphate alpha-N-acetylglucosaminyl 1-phosphate transferase [Nitrospinota bacterium]